MQVKEPCTSRKCLRRRRSKIPLAIPDPKARRETRERFGLPMGKVLFVFGFDLNSTISRKNPMAVIEAFRRAFPAQRFIGKKVDLVIKT